MEIVDFKIVTYERLQTVLSVNVRAGSFPFFFGTFVDASLSEQSSREER